MARSRGEETLGDAGYDLNGFSNEVLLSASFIYPTRYCSHSPKGGFHGILAIPRRRARLVQGIIERLRSSPLLELIEKKGISANSLDGLDHVIHEHESGPSTARVPIGMATLGGTEGRRFRVFAGQRIQR